MRRIRLSASNIYSLKENRYRAMHAAIQVLREQEQWHAMVALILSYVEALAGGHSHKAKKLMPEVFPDLFTEEVTPRQIWKPYRDNFLHRFVPESPIAMVRDSTTDGDYMIEIEVEGSGRILKGLNVDRFAGDFLGWIRRKAEHESIAIQ